MKTTTNVKAGGIGVPKNRKAVNAPNLFLIEVGMGVPCLAISA